MSQNEEPKMHNDPDAAAPVAWLEVVLLIAGVVILVAAIWKVLP